MTMTMALVLYFQMEGIPTYAAAVSREATVRKTRTATIGKTAASASCASGRIPSSEDGNSPPSMRRRAVFVR